MDLAGLTFGELLSQVQDAPARDWAAAQELRVAQGLRALPYVQVAQPYSGIDSGLLAAIGRLPAGDVLAQLQSGEILGYKLGLANFGFSEVPGGVSYTAPLSLSPAEAATFTGVRGSAAPGNIPASSESPLLTVGLIAGLLYFVGRRRR